MYLIAGLGNPDRKYHRTKHNIGFDCIDALIDRYEIPSEGVSMKGMYGKGVIAGAKVLLLKPLTFMNLSGDCIRAFVDYYKINPAENLIVIYDDVDLPLGGIRIRRQGSAGSHNGMKSVIQMLGTDTFLRVRIGIGPEPDRMDLARYVLSPFGKEERRRADEAIGRIPEIVETVIRDGADEAMCRYNRKASEQI